MHVAAEVMWVMQATSLHALRSAVPRSLGAGAALLGLTMACGSDPAKPTGNEAGEASGGSLVGAAGNGISGGSGGASGGSAGSVLNGGNGGAVTGLPAFGIAATGYGACGLDATGAVHCWGATPGEWLVPAGEFVQLRSGDSWVCAVRSDRSYDCFAEPFGKPGTIEFAPPPPASDLAVNSGAICVINEAGEMACGQDDFGVADLTPPSGRLFQRASVGSDFACGILKADGSVLCWGNEGEAGPDCIDVPAAGQLDAPAGAFVALHSNGYTTCALDRAGSLACWGAGEATDDSQATCAGAPYNYGQAAPPGGRFRSVSVSGGAHACGVKNDGTLACWGAGTNDECTLDVNWNCRQSRPPPGEFEQVAVGRTHSCAMTAERKVQCWGNNGTEPGGRTEPPAVFQ